MSTVSAFLWGVTMGLALGLSTVGAAVCAIDVFDLGVQQRSGSWSWSRG